MVIHGHVENGVIIPHGCVSLPDGTEVTIAFGETAASGSDQMSAEERRRYLAALARIDTMANENPGDQLRGADHDSVLYR